MQTCLTVLSQTLCFVVLFSVSYVQAQEKPEEVIGKIESALKQSDATWNCEKIYTPQGEPSVESPSGTQHMFKCQKGSINVTVFLLYGETKKDAEKQLDWSQRLEINQSKPIAGIGEQGYALSKPRFAWVTFRKSRVFCQVNAAAKDAFRYNAPNPTSSVSQETLKKASFQFARLVAERVPIN